MVAPARCRRTIHAHACLADAWIGIVGADALAETGVSPDDLADPNSDFTTVGLDLDLDQGRAMVDDAATCGVDLVEQFVAFLGQGLDQAQRDCLDRELDDEILLEVTAASLAGEVPSTDLQDELQRIGDACSLQ